MPIYWTFLIVSLALWLLMAFYHKTVVINGRVENRDHVIFAVIFGSLLIFFCGLRSGVADTIAYIPIFNSAPSQIADFDWFNTGKGPAFHFAITLYKHFISSDYHGWLFLIAVICTIPVLRTLLKYSSSFGFSCFLFISSTMFVYLVNGIRQFICVAIIFACIQFMEEDRFFPYLVICILLSFIHSSTLVLIPFFFITKIKPWTWGTWLMIMGGVIFGLYFDRFEPLVAAFLENTEYQSYIEVLSNGSGSNLYRLAIAGVPVLMSWIGRRYIWSIDDRIADICVNMSIFNFILYFIGSFTSGLAVGRMTAYFDIFNLLLLPWLVRRLFSKTSYPVLVGLSIFFYILFFYIQMVTTWKMNYVSDILNLYFDF